MARPQLWAPDADTIDFVVGDVAHAGDRDASGAWTCPVDLPHGSDYRVRRDAAIEGADPRSVDLPGGLDGPTRVFDFASLQWTDADFRPADWDHAVLYELHVGTFTQAGTLDAAIARLDHLASLGITHVEVMPVNGFAGDRGWGYDGVFLYAVHSAYGGPAALARFVDAAHARGLAVILDVVYNHVGPGWERLSKFAPYYDPKHETQWGPSFDLSRPEVRRFVCDNALMWLRDFHIDGLRLDAVQTIVDDSGVHILSQLSDEIRELSRHTGREFVVVAETILNEQRMVQPREAGGHGLDAHWHEDFHHALQAALTGERAGYYADFGPLATLAHVLRHGYWFDGTRRSEHLGTVYGEPGDGLHGRQLVAYLQTHDQVGNRADGARITDLVGHDAAKIGAALTLLGPCVPMIWQGEEWGSSRGFHFFCDHEPELGKAVREGRRSELTEFGFDATQMRDPQAPETMHACALDWEELADEPHASMLRWTTALLRLRRALGGAGPLEELEVEVDEDGRWLAMQRGPLRVVANFGSRPIRVDADGQAVLLCSVELESDPGARLWLPERAVAVLGPG
jgi:maltooligosyltrehalose trehalohydrolase